MALKTSPDTVSATDVIVVTASRSKRRLSETPASVSVITKKEIKVSPAKTVEDLLTTQTGVQPVRTAAIGEGIPSSIIMRGIPGALAASRTLILVDNIPTNASGTPFLIVNEVPPEAIERIEIVRGPYSSLYGANALGGVINIITAEPQKKVRGSVTAETSYPFTAAYRYSADPSSAASALRGADTQAYYNVTFTGSGTAGKTGILFSGGYRTIGNYLLRDSVFFRVGDITYYKKALNYDYDEYRLFGKANLHASDNSELSLHVRFFKSDLGFGRTRKIILDTQDIVTKGQKLLIGPQFKWSPSRNVQLRSGLFYRTVTGEFFNEDSSHSSQAWVRTYWKSLTHDVQFETQGMVTLNESNALTGGVEFLSNNADFGATINPFTGEVMPGSFSTNKGIVNGAGYCQYELRLFDRLLIVPSIRDDYHSAFGNALSPRFGFNAKVLDWLRLRASTGRSFRAPSLAELYLPDLHISPIYSIRSNPDLKPEYVWGGDCGMEIEPWKFLSATVDMYYNSLYNLIGQKLFIDSTGIFVSHRNITKAWTEGIEAELQARPLSWLRLSANGTLQNSFDSTYHVRLDYMPDFTFGGTAGITRSIGNVRTEAWIGFKRVGPRICLDFSSRDTILLTPEEIRMKVPSIGLHPYSTTDLSLRAVYKRYSIMITVQNVFNAAWEEALGSLAPGRFASLKMGYEF